MTGDTTVFKEARVVDPATGVDGIVDVGIAGGRVTFVGVGSSFRDSHVLDCNGLTLIPGLVDPHTHLRTPGQEWKETLETGSASAAAGGFTSVCCMPNTDPPLDSVETLRDLQTRIASKSTVRIYPIATISKGRQGIRPVDYHALRQAGAIGFSDDGDGTLDPMVMVDALEATVQLGCPAMVHCEEQSMSSGSMHKGDVSDRLGISGIPAEAEELGLSRDLLLAHVTGGWLYALHVSTGRGIGMIERARARGVNVTAEVMPHHLLLSDEWVAGSRQFCTVDESSGLVGKVAHPNTKVNPPLRPCEDAWMLLDALKNGGFDLVGTDHAPHAAGEKNHADFETASPGMSGFEVALPMMLSLVRAGHLTMSELITFMSWRPAAILGLPGGRLTPGSPADLTLFDPEATWTVEAESLRTKSPNTPTIGMEMTGKVVATYVGGVKQYAA